MKIEKHILDILNNCTAKDNLIYINDSELPREDYVKVNTVFERLRGKWNRSKKAHIFPYDIETLFDEVLVSGLYPDDNPESYYYTPTVVVQEILEVLNIPNSDWVNILEPTAGTGHIADELPDSVNLDCVEFTDLNCSLLRKKGYNVTQGDFLQFVPDKQYHHVVMNPPFNIPGKKNVYIDMIYHAFSMLQTNGKLAVIVPQGWTYRKDKKHREFREFIFKYLYSGWNLESGTFKEAGTNISTTVLLLDKDSDWKLEPRNGWTTWNAYMASVYMDNDYDTYQALERKHSRKDFNIFIEEVIRKANVDHFEGVSLTEEDVDDLFRFANDR